MSLEDWYQAGWLRPYETNSEQIQNLFEIIDRDLKDAARDLSPDWKFGIAYNAVLKLCTILLNATGFRPERNLAHYRTLQSLPHILGKKYQEDAGYLETCRVKRNTVEYDLAGQASEQEAKELIDFAHELKSEVIAWLKQNRPELL